MNILKLLLRQNVLKLQQKLYLCSKHTIIALKMAVLAAYTKCSSSKVSKTLNIDNKNVTQRSIEKLSVTQYTNHIS